MLIETEACLLTVVEIWQGSPAEEQLSKPMAVNGSCWPCAPCPRLKAWTTVAYCEYFENCVDSLAAGARAR